ncbi:MAG: 2-dehydro-3-deoxygalactonokinase, partial [Bacteroidota bacterium]
KEGIQKAMEGRLLNSLFSVRTNTLLKNISKADNYYYLSGLLIGFELKNLQAFNGQILLNGEIRLANLYHMALSILGLDENLLLITSNDLANCIPKAHLKLYQQQQLS